MKLAVVSDERYHVHEVVLNWLSNRGYEPILFGALHSEKAEESWVLAAQQASLSIRSGQCQEGIFFCWTGTGVSITANKFEGIRAALCTDAETARGARIWNHANVLALSNRLLSPDLAQEILSAWFDDFDHHKGAGGVAELVALEKITHKIA